MKRDAPRDRILAVICALSLAGYLCFSAGLRYWLQSWSYFRELYAGLSSSADPIGIQIWKRQFLGVPWNTHQLLLMIGILSLSLLIALLVWQLLRRRVSLVLVLALLVPACLVVPQTLLALLLWPDGRGQITWTNHVCILGLVALTFGICLLVLRSNRPAGANSSSGDTIGLWGVFFLVPALVVLLTTFLLGIGNDPGYDARAYHLPLAAGYSVSNSIPQSADITFNYPSNAELMLRWFLLPRNDRLVGLPSFLAVVMIALILYKLCRLLGSGRQSALIGAATAITFPVLPFLATIPGSDLFGIAMMLSALFFLISFHRTGRADSAYLVCLGLALGLALGTRFSLLPASAFIILALLAVMLKSDHDHPTDPRLVNWPGLCRAFIVVGLGAFIGGGYWFARNALLHGNPLYPIGVLGLSGMSLDAISPVIGAMSEKPWRIAIYPWTEIGYTYIYDTGVGAVFTAIVLPGLIWWPFSMIRNWKTERFNFLFERILVYLCVLFCGLYFLSRPSVYTRHAGFGILVSFFLVAEMWSRIRRPLFRIVLFSAYLVMCVSLEKSLTGAVLYKLATPAQEGCERFGLPPAIDQLPPSRIFNAASAHMNYGCMGRDYRHKVLSLFLVAKPQDIREAGVDYLVIFEKQKPSFEGALRLELVESKKAPDPGDSVSLYRVLRP